MTTPKAYRQRSLLQIIFGSGNNHPNGLDEVIETAAKKAEKCDMCKGILGVPACVRACPTGAAFRVSPEVFLGYVEGGWENLQLEH